MALLAATKKSGELRVVGGKLDGRVHLDAGKVVGADVGRADSFVDAVFELLRLTTGKFSFDAEKGSSDPADPVDIEPLLLEAGARLTEWHGIEAVVPSMDHAVQLAADLGDPHVTLAADQWRMVVAVAGAACVHEVADRLGLGEYAACKSLKDLVESGVVLVADPPKAAAKPAPKAEPVAEKQPEPAPAAEPAPEPVAAAAPEPERAEEPEPEPEPEKKPEPKAEKKPEAKADAPVHIEPERKADTTAGKVAVPALTTKDQTSPIPPGDEPFGAKVPRKPAAAPAPAATAPAATAPAATTEADEAPAAAAPKPNTGVSASQAKALVSQLAAMSSEKPAAKAPAPAAAAEAKDDEAQAAETDAASAKAKDEKKTESAEAPADEAASAAEGDADEPLNRGLLLKFLSSVRQ